jgi:hypothetical protein
MRTVKRSNSEMVMKHYIPSIAFAVSVFTTAMIIQSARAQTFSDADSGVPQKQNTRWKRMKSKQVWR